ncbi:MAG: porin, partial [Pirellulaceae bacterium]|nr:porin [Pirellulaceae bacterium]
YDDLHYTFQHDLGINDGLGGPNADSEWYGINQYLVYDINDCWAVGGRFEWFRDDDGARIGANGAGEGSYYAVTTGLNYKYNANFTLRPELRWDWFDGMGNPYDFGNSKEQFTFGFDGVFTF